MGITFWFPATSKKKSASFLCYLCREGFWGGGGWGEGETLCLIIFAHKALKTPCGDLHQSPEWHSCLNNPVHEASSPHLTSIVFNTKEFKEERRGRHRV